ncbi:MAG: sensor histidine kinase [Burkholderiales bacterium]
MSAEAVALADLLDSERETLLAEWRQKVRALPDARHLSVPTLNDDVPKLLDELAEALRHPKPTEGDKQDVKRASVQHGAQRVSDGYDIGEVVAEYSMLRACIHTLALIHGVPLRDGQIHTLNNMLDHAIGIAVQTFVVECELAEKRRREKHLAFIAHDLRTPLHAVALAARVLEQNGLLDDQRRRMIDLLKRNVRQISSLVDSVLEAQSSDMSDQRGEPEKRTLQLWPLVEELVSDLQPTADHSATRLANEVPDDLLIHADAAMLRRIFQNLIRNAVAAAPRGHVRIGARMVEVGGGVSCWIQDDGAGLSAERVGKALDAPPADGADDESSPRDGVGIAIVKAFVEAHGGSIEIDVSSSDHAGSSVRFWLPNRDEA